MRKGYKMTKLGEIPVDWEVVKLGDIGEFFKGKGISKSELVDGGDFPCVRYGEIYTIYDIIIKKISSRINKYSANQSVRFYAGDLLFTGSGETAEDIGKCVTYLGNEAPYASGDLIILRPNKGDSSYLSYSMNANFVRKQTRKYGQGNSVVHIYAKHLSQLKFPLPPLQEQQKIANILSTVDEKIDLIQAQIQDTQALKKGLMQRLLTKGIGHTVFKESKLGEIPVDWEVVKLGEVGALLGGYAFKSKSFNSVGKGFQVIRMSNIQAYGLEINKNPVFVYEINDKEKGFLLKKGDVLITLTGTVGKTDYGHTAYIQESDTMVLNQRVGKYNYGKCLDGKFIFYTFGCVSFRKQFFESGKGGTGNQANVGKSGFESIKILFPPLQEQQKIAQILSTVDDKLDLLQEKKTNYQALKKGLMQQLLTGKIRVQVAQDARTSTNNLL